MMDSQLIEEYRERGWVKIPGLVDEAAVRRLSEIVREAFQREEFHPPAVGPRADQATDEYKKTMTVLVGLWHAYPEVRKIALKAGEIVSVLIGCEGVRLWSDRVFVKPRKEAGSKPTIWHQDLPKLPFDRRGTATVWIAVNEIPETRGPLSFLDGSHRLGPLGAVSQFSEERTFDQMLTNDDRRLVGAVSTAAPLSPGDATVHAGLTLHRAAENLDSEDRIVLAITYFDAATGYTGVPNQLTDNLGLKLYEPFDHDNFPLIQPVPVRAWAL